MYNFHAQFTDSAKNTDYIKIYRNGCSYQKQLQLNIRITHYYMEELEMTIGFPSGCWSFNNGSYTPTTFNQSDVFAMYGIPVASHENPAAIGLLNTANFLDSSAYSDVELGNRNLCAYMNAMGSYQQYMQTSGLISPLGPTGIFV